MEKILAQRRKDAGRGDGLESGVYQDRCLLNVRCIDTSFLLEYNVQYEYIIGCQYHYGNNSQ